MTKKRNTWTAVKTVLLLICLCAGLHAKAQTKSTEILLETTAGNIRLALYDETPLHRDNFLKLTKMGIFDSLLFHRVIRDFMIQGGDLNSKHAKPGELLGSGELDYTVPAEFRLPKIFHRHGALAMAREGDERNPEMRSGACQFYIVWGRKFSDAHLDKIQERLDTTNTVVAEGDSARIIRGGIKLTPEMREAYKTVGGTPHLDGQYTVFGEVVEGLDIVDKIQQAETDKNNRPLADIRIIRATVTKDLPGAAEKEAAAKKKNATAKKGKAGRKAATSRKR
ncbi:MAG: peptidylprolyl isomerase [Prevotella sp.]|nr:peptidylprolyl isomerase [Prevotella sp.]